MNLTNRNGLGVRRVAAMLALLSCAAGAAGEWVNPTYQQIQGKDNARWAVNSSGYVAHTSTGGQSYAVGLLHVNGNRFSSYTSARMSPDGREYLFTGRLGSTIAVSRRILVDPDRHLIRFAESITNIGTSHMTAQVMSKTSGGSSVSTFLAGSGRKLTNGANQSWTGPLGADEVAVAATHPGAAEEDMLFLLAGQGCHVRPKLALAVNQVVVTYDVPLAPRQTATIVYAVVHQGKLTPATIPKRVGQFCADSRLIGIAIPKELTESVANFDASFALGSLASPEALLEPVRRLAEKYQVKVGKDSLLVLDADTRLTGKVTAEAVTLECQFGRLQPKIEEIALLQGGSRGPVRVYFRNGEIFTGKLTVRKMKIRTPAGIEAELDPDRFEMLFCPAAEGKGKMPPGAVALLITRGDQRLLLRGPADLKLDATSPWGVVPLGLDRLVTLTYRGQNNPGFKARLCDGSRLPVLIHPKQLKLTTLGFGEISLPSHQIGMLSRLSPSPHAAATTGRHRVRCRLIGNGLLIGSVDIDTITVMAKLGEKTLAMKDVQSIRRTAPKDTNRPNPWPIFSCLLAGGDRINGQVRPMVLKLRACGTVLKVPLQHVEAISILRPPSDKK